MPINRIRLDDVDVRNVTTTTTILNDAIEGLGEEIKSNFNLITATNNTVQELTVSSSNTINQLNQLNGSKANIESPTFFGTVRAGSVLITNEVLENLVLVGTGASGTLNIDLETSGIYYYQPPATANWTFNFRGSSSLSLDAYMSGSQFITATILVTNGSTAYRSTAYQVDGVSVTPRWADAAPPSAGNVNSVDIYTFNILKRASATFDVFASIARFA